MGNVAWAFGLTLIAGLSTGIGSVIALFAKKTNTKFLSISLGFSAGVMIYISMVEIFPEATASLSASFGEKTGTLVAIISFFAGMILMGLIDKLVPSDRNPHEVKNIISADEGVKKPEHNPHLMRTGIFTALAIVIHNLPEGLATFITALQSPSLVLPIVVAIALHNIPEGIAVSVPIYYATGDRKKAFFYSFASGLSEPIGALIGYLILMPFMNDMIFGVLFGLVAGIMVFISLDELLPSARIYGEHHLSIYGLVAGMAVMAVSLWLFL